MSEVCSVFLDPPADFNPGVIAAGCYCEFEDKILILKRNPHKALGDTWGVPAGKLEEGESPRETTIREIYEEIGVKIKEEELDEVGKIYVRRSSADVVLHLFRKRFLFMPVLNLNLEEHSQAHWVTVMDALQLPHSTGGIKALKFYSLLR